MSERESSNSLNQAADAIAELRCFVHTASQGFGWAGQAVRVHNTLLRIREKQHDPETIEALRQQAEQAEAFFRGQNPKGFPYLWSIASVRLWSILEVAVDDLILDSLRSLDVITKDSVLYALEGPLIDFALASPELRAAILFESMKEKCRCRHVGVSRFEALLQQIGLGGPVPADVRKVLLELSQVRHLIVHKNGIVDKRFSDACPWLGLDIGAPLPLTANHYLLYSCAADWYIVELDRRVSSRARTESPDDLHLLLERKLKDFLQSRFDQKNSETNDEEDAVDK